MNEAIKALSTVIAVIGSIIWFVGGCIGLLISGQLLLLLLLIIGGAAVMPLMLGVIWVTVYLGCWIVCFPFWVISKLANAN